MNRKHLAAWAVAVVSIASSHAFAQTKVTVGLTQFNEVAPVMIAKEEGFFDKHGLDVTIQLIPLNSTMPAALQSDSIQVAGLTPPVMLQAVDSGIDLVGIAGGSVGSKADTNFAIVVGTTAGIATPADLVGKKIGVPGLGATLHVLCRKWLTAQGIDYTKVTFIESPFPQMAGMLKGGSVDAVVSADPFKGRIVDSGSGTIFAYMSKDLPDGMAAFLYASTRDWAMKHPDAAKAFKAALAEGVMFASQNLEGARTDFGKYVKLPPPVLAQIKFTGLNPEPDPHSLQLWIDVMNEQKMLKSAIMVDKVLFR